MLTAAIPRATLATPPPDPPEQPPPQQPSNSRRRNSSHHLTTRRCSTLHPTPTPTRHRAPPTDQMSPTARQCRPHCPPPPAVTPRFHAYLAESIYIALVQERASGMVCNVQMVVRLRCAVAWPACLPACHRMAACHTATEPLRRLHRNRRLHVVMRSDREAGTADACHAFRFD